MRVHRVLALVAAALSLTMTSAHVLEMPRKMTYDMPLYSAVNTTLYRYFAIVGGTYQILAIVLAIALAWRAARERTAVATLVAAVFLTLSFVSWLIVISPANTAIEQGASWDDGFRMRWEVGHAIGFGLSLIGFVALAIATVGEIPIRPIRVEASRVIKASPDELMALYLSFDRWPVLFPDTIRAVHVRERDVRSARVDVEHRTAGTVPNVVTVVGDHEVALEETKRRYHARFLNRFELVPDGCRYVVTADIVLRGALRALRWLAAPIARRQIRRYVLAPMARQADELRGSSPALGAV